MITRIQIKNFKLLDEVDIELGKAVVLIGQNNSGKTTALQAFALWETGLKKWNEKRKGKSSPEKRSAVTINRNDLISIPVPGTKLLWRNLKVRDFKGWSDEEKKKPINENIRFDIIIEGISNGKLWKCGLEFDYANEESLYCRPLRLSEDKNPKRMPVPTEAENVKMAFLPPMSGLAATEPKWEAGRINVLVGEGQTAQVLRNLCYQIYDESNGYGNNANPMVEEPNTGYGKVLSKWQSLSDHIKELFGVGILPPKHIAERGEITMTYKDINGIELDISSSGRGLQQTLLLLAYLYANPNTILLLDEPDAHLEIFRQRQIYKLLTEIAEQQNCQVIAASHSEVVLNEAAEKDIVVAFVGKPHRIDNRGSQVLKALKDIGFDQYYMAEQNGWVLYLEGSNDLAILQAFAKTLGHKAQAILERPFVYYVGTNSPKKARDHFYALQEAKNDLMGIAIFDHLDTPISIDLPLTEMMWKKREIENYLCKQEVLLKYARYDFSNDLFGSHEAIHREKIMTDTINEITKALEKLGKGNPWSDTTKVTDEFLNPLFEEYFKKLELPNLLRKSGFYLLASLVSKDMIDSEVIEKLDAIYSISKSKEKEKILIYEK